MSVLVGPSDPNWFFSTLSQSAAAVVGIIGGFFVSRLLQHLPGVQESRDTLIGRFLQDRSASMTLYDGLRRFNAWAENLRPQVEEALSQGATQLTVHEVYGPTGGGTSSGPGIVYPVSKDWLTDLEATVALQAALDQPWLRLIRLENVDELPLAVARLAEVRAAHVIPDSFGQPFDSHVVELQRLADDVRAHRAHELPPSTGKLLVLLGFIAVVGIILPLEQLSAGSGSRIAWKWGLLLAFAFGLGLVGAFLQRLMSDLQSAAALRLPERDRVWSGWPR